MLILVWVFAVLSYATAHCQTHEPVKIRASKRLENFSSPSARTIATQVNEGVPIEAEELKSKRIMLQSLGKKETQVIQGNDFTLKPGQLGIVQTGNALIPREILGRDNVKIAGFALPFQLLSVDQQGNGHKVEAFIDTRNGLALHADIPGYSGTVWIAIQDIKNRQAIFDFTAPITVILTGMGLELAPERFQFLKANDFQPFRVSILNPPDPVILNARLTGIPNDLTSATPLVEVPLPVYKPRLEVRLSTKDIAGFGLDTATVTIQANGYVTPEGHKVRLKAKGRLDSTVLTLDRQGFAQTTIRSAGIGADSVQASTSDNSAVSESFQYIFPWAFFISTVLGALIGASIERMQSKRPHGTWLRRLLLGILVGLAFTLLFAVGISGLQWILPSAKSGEAVIAAIALAGAFGGFRLLDRAGK
jgi:hypothetical protein